MDLSEACLPQLHCRQVYSTPGSHLAQASLYALLMSQICAQKCTKQPGMTSASKLQMQQLINNHFLLKRKGLLQ